LALIAYHSENLKRNRRQHWHICA